MPKYEPIEVGIEIKALLSNLHSISWTQSGAVLEFFIPDSDDVLKIAFDGLVVVRILDEFHISTEDDPEHRYGMVPNHFAYKVTGHVFADVQSVYLRENGSHYQFVTGSGCADVISEQEPNFWVRPLSASELAELEEY